MLSLGCAAGVAVLRRTPAWPVVVAGAALLAAGNLLSDSLPLFPARAVAGAGGGLLVALAAAAIARRRDVDRAAAAFLFLQAASQTALVQWVAWDAARAAAAPLQQALAFIGLLSVPLALLLPSRLGLPLAPAGDAAPRPSRAGHAALLVAGLFVGAVVGLWAYLSLWMESKALPASRIGTLLALSLAGQMAGALLAMVARRGRSSNRALAAGGGLLLAVAGLLWLGPAGPLGMALALLFGFAWMFATPALTGFLEEVDPARGSLPHAAAAQLLGAALIPTLVGALAQGLDGTMMAFATLVVASMMLLLLVRAASGRQRPGSSPS